MNKLKREKNKEIKKPKEDKEEISSLNKILKGAGIVLLGMVIGKIIGYLYTVIVARLGTEPYGMLNIGYSIISLLIPFSLLGLHNALARFVPYYLAKNNKAKVKGAILTSLKICIPLSIILAIAMFLFSDKIAIIFFHNEKLIPILKIFSFMLPFTAVGTLFFYIFIAFQKVKYEVLNREIVERISRLGFTLLFIGFGLGIFGASISYVISAFVVVVVSFFILEKKIFSIFKTKFRAKYCSKEMLKYSLPLVFSAFLTFIANWADTMMLGFFKTTSEVGIYNASHNTATLMFVIPLALTTLFLPIITQFYSKKKKNEIKKVYSVISRWIFFVNFPILLTMIFFSSQIINLIFGQEYLLGSMVLSILAGGYLFYSFSYPSVGVLSMAKKSNLIFRTTLIFAISNIILNYILIPPHGINGAAIATSFSFILGSVIYIIFSYKIIQVWPIKKSYLKAIFTSLISILFVYFIAKVIFITLSVYSFILIFLLFLAIYIGLLFLFRSFELEDKEMFEIFKKKLTNNNKNLNV